MFLKVKDGDPHNSIGWQHLYVILNELRYLIFSMLGLCSLHIKNTNLWHRHIGPNFFFFYWRNPTDPKNTPDPGYFFYIAIDCKKLRLRFGNNFNRNRYNIDIKILFLCSIMLFIAIVYDDRSAIAFCCCCFFLYHCACIQHAIAS